MSVQHVQGEHNLLHGVAQEGHMTHKIDQDNFRNAVMQLYEVVVFEHGEVHFQHFQGELEQLHGAAQEDHVAHQIDQDEVRNAIKIKCDTFYTMPMLVFSPTAYAEFYKTCLPQLTRRTSANCVLHLRFMESYELLIQFSRTDCNEDGRNVV
jgi:hypothetical protein